MSESNVELQLHGSQEDFVDLFGVPASFVETSGGSPMYMRSIFINATAKKTIAVGASETQAVEVVDNTLKVIQPGRGLFSANIIMTQLSIFAPGDEMELTLYSDNRYSIEQVGGSRSTVEDSVPMDNSVKVPNVGDFNPTEFIALDPNEFVAALSIVANASHQENSRPMFKGVYYELLKDGRVFLAGSNGGSSFSSTIINTSTVGKTPEGTKIRGLLIPGDIQGRAGLFRQGDVLELHTSETGDVHFLVRSKDEVLYNIRMAQISGMGEHLNKYPIRKLAAKNLQLLQRSGVQVDIDRNSLLERLDAAVTIGALDQISEMGSNRRVNLYFKRADPTDPSSTYVVEARVYNGAKGIDEDGRPNYTGVVKFEDETDVQSHDGLSDREVAFSLHYGLYAGVLRSAPVEGAMDFHITLAGSPLKPIAVNVVKGGFAKEPVVVSDDFDLGTMPEFMTTFAIEGLYVAEYED